LLGLTTQPTALAAHHPSLPIRRLDLANQPKSLLSWIDPTIYAIDHFIGQKQLNYMAYAPSNEENNYCQVGSHTLGYSAHVASKTI
jgi:hypothetical protein